MVGKAGDSFSQGSAYTFAASPARTGGAIAAGSGEVSITAADVVLDGNITTAASVSIAPSASGMAVDPGSTLDTAANTVELSDAELDRVTAGTLKLGGANSGAMTVTADITRPAGTAMQLTSGGDVVISGGQVDTGGGTLRLQPGAAPAAVKPTASGTDATASTVWLARGLTIDIAGPTVDMQYTQLNVSGTVDLAGVELVLNGPYVPVNGNVFTIVSATTRTGAFNGINDGDQVTFNGWPLTVHYTPTAVTLNAIDAYELGSIRGQKFDDRDADGVHDPGEPGLNGWTIQLVNAAGQVVQSTTTMDMDRNHDGSINPETERGLYAIQTRITEGAGIEIGQYELREVQQSGWIPTVPSEGVY